MILSLVGRVAIYNQVILSTTWFVIMVWRGPNKILRKIRGAIRTYFWYGKEQLTRTRVSQKMMSKKEA